MMALPFTIVQSTLRQKGRIMETQILQNAKKYYLQKSSKRNQNPSRYYYNLIINLKFQHKPKYLLSKIFIYKKK